MDHITDTAFITFVILETVGPVQIQNSHLRFLVLGCVMSDTVKDVKITLLLF